MSKLTRGAALSAIDLSIKNDSGADTFRNEHEYEISRVIDLGPAKPEFGKCNCIGVVVDHDWQSDGLGDHFRDWKIAPEEVRNVERISGRRIDQTRQTHAHTFDRAFVA